MLKAKSILVPIDFTKGSELALDWAIMVAKEQKGSSIALGHIVGAGITRARSTDYDDTWAKGPFTVSHRQYYRRDRTPCSMPRLGPAS